MKPTLRMPTCSMAVPGRLAVTRTDSTGEPDVDNDSTYELTVGTASAGCADLAAVGDNWAYEALHAVTTPSGGTTVPGIVHTP
ncbi:hypothetical protein ACH4MM_30180 [Streptomyces pratensis]|uniref:hypothetical protein n=1 Tax=Streptomyces pratensis TaxID=1169025 RepID=UPI0037A63BA8